jgi:4-amino-4-deoxychorismate lyase
MRLGLAMPGEALLRAELSRVAPGDHAAKIIVTRGAGGRGYGPASATRASRIVAAFPLPGYPAQNAQAGVRVRRCGLVLSEQPRLAGAKTLNRLENVLARGEWNDPAIAEGLLADARGSVIEGTMSNVFIVRHGRAATPRLDRCGIVGAQRERVRELLAGMGVACEEASFDWSAVLEADEVFLTNSLIGAWPVAAFESASWQPGAITRAVQQAIAADDAPP